MRCPYCSSVYTRVVDKRDSSEDSVTRRRRECLKCAKRFTTYEKVEVINLVILKKDGRKEQFDRDKLKAGIMIACEKRPVSEERIEKLIDQIEAKLRKIKKKEIEASFIGEEVVKRLKKIDEVAYIRFASVYKSFDDLKSFEKELKKLKIQG